MPDMDKVIGALEHCRAGEEYKETPCHDCPYTDYGITCREQLYSDVIALLRKRTFRVIDKRTGKEADDYEIALHEDWAKSLCYCDMDGFALQQDGTLLLMDECGKYEYCDPERFEVRWDEDE